MKQASDAGADIGNQKLATLRRTNMIENFAKELHENNLNEVVVKNIKRDEGIGDMAIQSSQHGLNHADVTHRGWALIAEATNKVTGETTEIPIRESIQDHFPKETYLAGVFPFFNTYAKHNNDARAYKPYTTSPRRKFWSRKNKKNKQNNTINTSS